MSVFFRSLCLFWAENYSGFSTSAFMLYYTSRLPLPLQVLDDTGNSDRLMKLAAFQKKALEHAFSCKFLFSYILHSNSPCILVLFKVGYSHQNFQESPKNFGPTFLADAIKCILQCIYNWHSATFSYVFHAILLDDDGIVLHFSSSSSRENCLQHMFHPPD